MLEKVHEKQQTSVHFVFFKGTKGKQINSGIPKTQVINGRKIELIGSYRNHNEHIRHSHGGIRSVSVRLPRRKIDRESKPSLALILATRFFSEV